MPLRSPTVADVTEFLRQSREEYSYDLARDATDRAEALDDVRFAAAIPYPGGGTSQWSEAAIKQRIATKRPILTENRLRTFINQVVNDGRRQKPAIKLTAGDGGTKQTADMLQARIRHIEYESDADTVYDTARKHQVTSGRAAIRVTTKAKDSRHQEQEARIERISNQFSVVWGPHKEYDASDAERCWVVTNITKAEHERRFGKETVASQHGFWEDTAGCPAPDWFNTGGRGEEVQIAEKWVKVYVDRRKVQLVTGEEVYEEEAQPGQANPFQEAWTEKECKVYQYIINGVEILDETEFLVPEIGIVPQWGDEEVVDGITRHYSLIRQSKDPQRLINLYVSNIAHITGDAPKNPFRAPAEAIQGFEEEWANMGTDPKAYLPYNQYDANGREVRAPEREVAEPPIQALVTGYLQAVEALKASMGIFDASLGAKSNETSGIAIKSRESEADNANYHFHDNESRTRKRVGRILLQLIQKLDTKEKNVPTRTEDGKTKMVRINTAEPYKDPETGAMVQHLVTEGEYLVSTGRSYTSAREEAFDTYSQIAGADPTFMLKAGDILFRNLDAPGSEEIADRYERTLPPELRPQKGEQPVPPEVQQAMAAMKQQLEQTEAFARSLHEQILTKQAELDAKKEMVQMQEETKRTIALAQAQSADGIELLKAEILTIKHQLDLAHQADLARQAQQHEADLASQAQLHESDLASQAQLQQPQQPQQ